MKHHRASLTCPAGVQADLDAQREHNALLQESMQRLEAEVAPEDPPGLPPAPHGTPGGVSNHSFYSPEDTPRSAVESSSALAAANSQLTRKVVELSENFSRWARLPSLVT